VVNRGEVWWVEHPAAGRRPHLILTRQAAIGVLAHVVAVPATRTVRAIPTEVPLGTDDGMPVDCALTLDNVRVVRKAYCTERICTLTAAKMHEVCRALATAAGCG
jgi:mRNA interferase MazF